MVQNAKKIISPYFQFKQKHMSTKTVDLTISERFATTKIINEFKGNLTQLSTLLDDVKKIAITEEEWKAANLVKTQLTDNAGNLTGQENLQWEDLEGQEKTIELDAATITYLTDEIKKRSDANEITVGDVALISLNKKLLA